MTTIYIQAMRSKVVGSALLGTTLILYGSYKVFSNRCSFFSRSNRERYLSSEVTENVFAFSQAQSLAGECPCLPNSV